MDSLVKRILAQVKFVPTSGFYSWSLFYPHGNKFFMDSLVKRILAQVKFVPTPGFYSWGLYRDLGPCLIGNFLYSD
jgi:hypothetical protein